MRYAASRPRFASFIERLRAHSPLDCLFTEGASCTYAQLIENIERWQARFETLHVAPGAVVGLRADYSFDSIAALLALLDRGVIVALIPRDRDSAQYLEDARAEALLQFDAASSHEWRVLGNPPPHALLIRLREAGDGGIVLFTSGSTGRPKAALQSAERLLHKFTRPGRRFRTLAFLLFDHIAGIDTLFYTLANGGALVLAARRDPQAILRLIASRRVEVLPASPSFLRMMCAVPELDTHDLASLQIITYGSEPMDPGTLARLNARFPHVQITQKYGTTETGSPRSVSRGNDSLWLRIRSEGVETKVVDGILWIRSEGTILGYLNAASPLDAEGWYCTGDLVEVDGEWMRFRGRATDIINVAGEKVAPAEVEQSILELDFVREAMVHGEPHPLLGQVVAARVTLVVSGFDEREAAKRIRAHCRQHLAPYKVPVRIEVVEAGLVTARQKVLRKGSTWT